MGLFLVMENYRSAPRSCPRVWLYSCLLFLVGIVVVLVAGELLVRLLVPKEFYFPINNIYRAVPTDIRYTYKPNYNGIAFGVPLKTNSLGFRGPEWSLAKGEKTIRIALIGDSHAFGYGVQFADTVGEKLATLLSKKCDKKYEVLNFGVAGYNSRQELAVLREEALRFKPDIIIVVPCNNDHDEARIADEQGFLRTVKKFAIVDKSINKLSVGVVPWLSNNSRLAFYLLFIKKQYELSNEIPKQLDPRETNISDDSKWWMGPLEAGTFPDQLKNKVYEPLKEIVNEAKKNNIAIVFANFNAVPDYRRLFAKLSHDENVPSIELLALFPEANNWDELVQQFGLGWNDHLNAIAHERWAQALYHLMKDQQMIRESQ